VVRLRVSIPGADLFTKREITIKGRKAWALDALIAYHDRPIPAIERGMSCLLSLLEQPDSWQWRYPVGAGLAGQFYAYYHSYPTVWPLQTLLHYRKKWGD
jgi:sporulenol synthase